MPADRPTDAEFDAYLDDELALADRLRIEDYLTAHPAEAARMMDAFRARTALRLIQPAPPPQPVEAKRLARRLSGASPWPLRILAASAVAAVLGLVTVPDQTVVAAPPAYLTDALQAYHTGILRAGMSSQLETPVIDAPEILRATRIPVPDLPAGWKVTDVQIFPSDAGPALQIMVRTPAGTGASIFAVRTGGGQPAAAPVAIRRAGASVAYWRTRGTAYALIGDDQPEALDLAAEDIADGKN